jgi:hypothetical protein
MSGTSSLTEVLGTRVAPGEADLLRHAAAAEQVTLSALIARVLREAIPHLRA